MKRRVSNSQQFLWNCYFTYPCKFPGKRVGYTRAELLVLNTCSPPQAIRREQASCCSRCCLGERITLGSWKAASSLGCLPLLVVSGSFYQPYPQKWHQLRLWGYLGTWGGEEEVARGQWQSQRMLQSQEMSGKARTGQVCGFYCHPHVPLLMWNKEFC